MGRILIWGAVATVGSGLGAGGAGMSFELDSPSFPFSSLASYIYYEIKWKQWVIDLSGFFS